MGKFNLQEEDLLSLDHDLYFIVEAEGDYFIIYDQLPPSDYNINKFIDLLTIEECKFLIAESVLDSKEVKEYFLRKLEINNAKGLRNMVRSLNKEELNEIISVLKYTRNFNGYLSYMLGDGKSYNFETEEERMSFIY